MHVHHEGLEVRTHGKGLYEITDNVHSKIDRCGIQNGTVTIFVQHTSCSIVIMENADPTARRDLEEFFEASCGRRDYYTQERISLCINLNRPSAGTEINARRQGAAVSRPPKSEVSSHRSLFCPSHHAE